MFFKVGVIKKKKIHRKISKACNFIKKETLAQMFSCEFSKNTFLDITPPVTAFVRCKAFAYYNLTMTFALFFVAFLSCALQPKLHNYFIMQYKTKHSQLILESYYVFADTLNDIKNCLV